MPQNVLKFFRTVPIVLNPDSNAEYTQVNGKWVVSIRTDSPLPGNKPMVLHELLHALHFKVLKQPTPVIARAYNDAIQQPPYNCAITLKAQPEFIAYLNEVLGPHQCR